jgi:hypothetical protein
MLLLIMTSAFAADLTCRVRGETADSVEVACLPALEASRIESYNQLIATSYMNAVAMGTNDGFGTDVDTYDPRALAGTSKALRQAILDSDAFQRWLDETSLSDEATAFRKFVKQYRRIKRACAAADRRSGW